MTKENAINWIRKSVNKDSRLWKAIESLVPELRESEDERIRMALIDGVRQIRCKNGITQEQMIAWLEKQKEQTEDLSTRLNGLMQEYVKAGKDEEDQEHRLKCYQLFWDALGDSEFFKQKEQKLDDVKREWWNKGYFKGRKYAHIPAKELGLPSSWDFQQERKPVEWSKEDKKILDELLDHCNTENATWYNWLKFLKNRGNFLKSNSNSLSWSKEDEENLGKLHKLLVICQGEKKFIPSDEYDKLDDWLKSLSPPQYCENCKLKRSVENWKPSKEQMEALKCAVEDVARFSKRGGRQVELENEPYYKALDSLYCNLEKLM